MTGKHPPSGFTLIELAVSLALLGLMVSLIGLALPLALSGSERSAALSDEAGTIQSAHHLLRRQIGEMPVLVSLDGHNRNVVFSGRADTMRFAANPVAARGDSGPQFVELSVMVSDGAARLVYASGNERRDLVADARTIRFSYFGRPEKQKDAAWLDVWPEAQRLPALVRIQVQPEKGAMPWPDLIIAVMAGPPPP